MIIPQQMKTGKDALHFCSKAALQDIFLEWLDFFVFLTHFHTLSVLCNNGGFAGHLVSRSSAEKKARACGNFVLIIIMVISVHLSKLGPKLDNFLCILYSECTVIAFQC